MYILTMGGSSSKTVYDLATEIVTEVITNNVQNCAAGVEQVARGNIVISGKGTTVDELSIMNEANVNLACLFSANTMNSITEELRQKIDQEVKAASEGWMAALSSAKSNAVIEMSNEIKNKLETNNIQRCLTDVQQLAEADVTISGEGHKIGKINIGNVSNNLVDCVSNTLIKNELDVIQDIKAGQVADSEVEADFSLFGFIGMPNPLSLFSGLGSIGKIIGGVFGFIFLMLIVFVIYKLASGGEENDYGDDYGDY